MAKVIFRSVGVLIITGIGILLATSSIAKVTRLHINNQIEFPSATTGVAWAADSKTLAVDSGYGKQISVWGIDGKKLQVMDRQVNGPWYEPSIEFLDGNKFVLTPPASEKVPHYALSVWDARNGDVTKNVDGPGWAYFFTVSNGQNTAVMSTDGGKTIAVYSTDTWVEFPRPNLSGLGHALSLALSPDGSMLALGTTRGKVAIFESKTGNLLLTIDAYDSQLGMGVLALAFSPDAAMIATGADASSHQAGDDTPVRIWSVTNGSLTRSFHAKGLQPIRTISWRVQGDRVAFVADNAVTVWNIADDTSVTQAKAETFAARFSPDGKLLAVCAGNYVNIFEIGDEISR